METIWKDVGTLLLSFLAIGILFSFAWFVTSTDNIVVEKDKEQVIEKLYDQGMKDDLYTLSHQAGSIFNVILSFFFCVFCAQVAEEIGEAITYHISDVNIQKYKK